MRVNDPQYAAKILAVLRSYYRVCGYPDAWLLELAEWAVSGYHVGLARKALEAFRCLHEHELVGWERDGLEYIEHLFTTIELTDIETGELFEELPI